MEMTPELESQILRKGHFAASLLDTWYCADSGNRAKIENTWPDVFYKVETPTSYPQT